MSGVAAVGAVGWMDAEALQHKRLTDAAQQFEGMFLQQLMKPMTAQKEGADKEDGDDSPGNDGSYQGLGVEAMAKAVASAGGMGIAKSVVKSVERESTARHEGATKIGQD